VNDTNKQIENRVASFVAELRHLLNRAAVDAVTDVLGSARVAPKRASNGATRQAPASTPSGRIRRSADQIAAIVSTVHGYIKVHPNTRSETIRIALKLPRPVIRDALDRLGDGKKIRMKGAKRGARYSASA
jgi:hypothetical protein